MEPLTETKWDAVISGTGLKHSLLALALSRSNKKILHVDQNKYYGDAEAAFSLQEVDEWVEKVGGETPEHFRNASLWKTTSESSNESEKLSFSRAYTLTLSPQIIYTRSKLLSQLVTSKVYRQLEFQAVGNWWILAENTLNRLPNGREDIFQDKTIDNRSKRGLMKFLKFVVDYENQTELWQPHVDSSLAGFLSSQFQFPTNLQNVICALTLSLETPEATKVNWSLPRISRHLTSIGVFGPGFGAVLPKWGGGADISQVACRAGAVGGGIYILGTGVRESTPSSEDTDGLTQVHLTNEDVVKTRHLIQPLQTQSTNAKVVSKIIAVVSSSLTSLFKNTVEGSPLAAVSVIVFPVGTVDVEGASQNTPIYIMAHSNETGECPPGQCVLYATMLQSERSHELLDVAVDAFLATLEDKPSLLYKLYYEQQAEAESSETSLDLAFNDSILDDVESMWRIVMGEEADQAMFMRFEDREGMNNDDDEIDEGY
ncbi:related to rab geranylgeranyl transferase component A [Phialocephala subalpina]|uniref:Rab proteins geranylgeranyltransferase n=1 Tax=Phialocephala subalpina TaxID=576137 RepID=A0A1L7WFV8_9HELO|nr:related to rab geranylgeranyl transferase component A [Phialocephala subalpina]